MLFQAELVLTVATLLFTLLAVVLFTVRQHIVLLLRILLDVD